ncbi:Alb1 [Geosmithia morbida]|uniref:Alb1 n=1 Tax=Geosmithia morbida TaxID=1094350 RepID=A0A9P4YRS0_9HYPO|nr:Alb1 [Geosmithia morbida]KAF4120637.1 Alb1 [Geosmithia morbida]
MAKNKSPTKNSRAARWASSPTNMDKSLKDVSLPQNTSGPQRPSVLAAHHSAGVQKKVKRKSQMTSKARKRQERSMQMAEAVLERTSKKVERSIDRGRNVQRRSKGWDEINKEAEAHGVKLVDVEDAETQADKDWETDEEPTPAAATVPIIDARESVDDDGYIAVDDDDII